MDHNKSQNKSPNQAVNDRSSPLKRLLKLRFLIPIKRGHRDPKSTSRAVAVGLAVAMTPTVGIQMPIVIGIWFLQKWLFKDLSFNLIIALAWTWVSNIFTAPFIYYILLITGKAMLGEAQDTSGFELFSNRVISLLEHDTSFIHSIMVNSMAIIHIWGMPMLIGSLPWMLIIGSVGYFWCNVFIEKLQIRRAKRKEKKDKCQDSFR